MWIPLVIAILKSKGFDMKLINGICVLFFIALLLPGTAFSEYSWDSKWQNAFIHASSIPVSKSDFYTTHNSISSGARTLANGRIEPSALAGLEVSSAGNQGPAAATILFEEKFEDGNLRDRGWYDNTNPVLSTSHASPGSTRSLEFRFTAGSNIPDRGSAMRKKFAPSESVYLSYYVKYSSNWVGSQRGYHPHEFYFLTNKSGDWSGLAYTPLTLYVEQNEMTPLVAIQDSVNIDTSRIGQNLTSVTENRALGGCNGDSDGYGNGTCYRSGNQYRNGKSWRASGTNLQRDSWQRVEAYIKLNTISNGKGVADGIIQYWLNGQLVMDLHNVILRTAKNADMQFNQFVIGPWIDSSPINQTFWIDNLVVATGRPGYAPPAAPSGLRVVSQLRALTQ